jgi:hypothetical protein
MYYTRFSGKCELAAKIIVDGCGPVEAAYNGDSLVYGPAVGAKGTP